MSEQGKNIRLMSASPGTALSQHVPTDAAPAPGRDGLGGTAESAAPVRAAAVIQSLDALDELSEAWDGLAAYSGSPVQDYGWVRVAASSFATDGQLHIVVAGAPPLITAIAPLVGSRHRRGVLELLGVKELYEPMDFLHATPAGLAALADALAGRGSCLFLNRLPVESAAIAALRRSYRGRGIVICHPAPGYPWIPLDAGWSQPERQLNAGRRSDLRRARRTAEKMGPLAFDILRPTPEELKPLLDEALRIEAASWKGRVGTALASDPVREAFYRGYAAAACTKGTLHISFLRIGPQAAAMEIAVESGNRFWLLRIGYDEAFAPCSPGALLMLETIRYAAARGLHSYEFLGTSESWTRMWTQLERPCVSLRAYPTNLRGMLVFAADIGTVARQRFGRVFGRTA